MARQLARIEVGNGHRFFLYQVLRQRHAGAKIGRYQRHVLDDQTSCVHLGSFNILSIDPIVPNVGIGERHDLLAIARVCEDFLVTGHGGVKHHLADGGTGGSNGISNKHRAVCERQNGGGK
jgi:hypothetical protein